MSDMFWRLRSIFDEEEDMVSEEEEEEKMDEVGEEGREE